MESGNKGFWNAIDTLVSGTRLVIDRPKGTRHPRYPDFVYPLDYGYLDETTTLDGAGIDVWRGTLADKNVTAVLCTIDLVKRDIELKLLVGCTAGEIELLSRFANEGPLMKGAVIRR